MIFKEAVLREAARQFGLSHAQTVALYKYIVALQEAGKIRMEAEPVHFHGSALSGILVATTRLVPLVEGKTTIGKDAVSFGFGCAVCAKYAMKLGEPLPGDFSAWLLAGIPPKLRGREIHVLWCASCRREREEQMLIAAGSPVPMVLHCPICQIPHVDPENAPPHTEHACGACMHVWRPRTWATHGIPPASGLRA